MKSVTLDEEKCLCGRQKSFERSMGLPEETNSTRRPRRFSGRGGRRPRSLLHGDPRPELRHDNVPTCLRAYMFTCLHAYMLTCLPTCMFTYSHAYILICLNVGMIHAYMLASLHAYTLTCMCVHVCTLICFNLLRHDYVST